MFSVQQFLRKESPVQIGETKVKKRLVIFREIRHYDWRVLEICELEVRLEPQDERHKRPYWKPVKWLN